MCKRSSKIPRLGHNTVKLFSEVLASHDGARSEVSNVFSDVDFKAHFEGALSSGLSRFSLILLSLTVIPGIDCKEDDFYSVNTLATSLSSAKQKNDDLSTDYSSTQFSNNDTYVICDDFETSTEQQSTPSPRPLQLNSDLHVTTSRPPFQSQGYRDQDKVDEISIHRKGLLKKRPLKTSGISHFVDGSRLDWGQKLVLLKESFEKKKAFFVNDLSSFIREVHGGFSLAPEMDIEREFKTLSKTFNRWKLDFKVFFT